MQVNGSVVAMVMRRLWAWARDNVLASLAVLLMLVAAYPTAHFTWALHQSDVRLNATNARTMAQDHAFVAHQHGLPAPPPVKGATDRT